MSADNYNLIVHSSGVYFVYLNLGASENIDPRKLVGLAPDAIEREKEDAYSYTDDDFNWTEYGTTYIDLDDLAELERYEPPADPKVVGKGIHTLMLEHYPTYRYYAEDRNEPYWPLRVYDPAKRNQAVIGMFGDLYVVEAEDNMPEKVVKDMIIYLPEKDHIKRVLSHIAWEHSMNTYGRFPDSDWYVTNPQAIEDIVDNVINFEPEISYGQFAYDSGLP